MRIHARLPENSSDNVFSSPQLILQFYRGCPIFQRKLKFSKVSERFQHFPGGVGGGPNIFPEGPNANFYRNGYKVVIFQGGPDPTPPLDPRMFGLG